MKRSALPFVCRRRARAFRSIVVAVKAIVLNLLSVAAAYGVLALVFQHGVGKGLLGFSSTAGISPVVPGSGRRSIVSATSPPTGPGTRPIP